MVDIVEATATIGEVGLCVAQHVQGGKCSIGTKEFLCETYGRTVTLKPSSPILIQSHAVNLNCHVKSLLSFCCLLLLLL